MKEAFTTKLEKREAAWVEEQAAIFQSKSLVVSLCVRLVVCLISRGIIRWELVAIKELLQENSGNAGRQVPPRRDAGCAANGSGPTSGALREIYATASSAQVATGPSVLRRSAYHHPLAGKRSPFLRQILTCGARA